MGLLFLKRAAVSLFLMHSSVRAYRTTPFYDDFSSDELDSTNWLVAFRQWGGQDVNGGVVPENLRLENNNLVMEAHGDLYEGEVLGINKDLTLRSDGKRVGAAIATRDYFCSGSYEVRMKIAPSLGAASAMWAFHYEEYYEGDFEYERLNADGDYYVVNHEINIEFPGRPAAPNQDIGFDYALFNTFLGEREGEYTTGYTELDAAQNDGQFHTYRFDWHTDDPRLEFFIDGILIRTITTNVPYLAARLWLGVWFPDGWAGTPNFDTEEMVVDYVKITPFDHDGDRWTPESFPLDGWANRNFRPSKQVFFEDFSSNTLDPASWLVAHKNWGGQLGSVTSYNGGVLPDNVKLENSQLILEAHGNLYEGTPIGINKNGFRRADGTRVGAAIATARYYGAGSYEVRIKIAPEMGVSTAMWTFHYEECYEGDECFQGDGEYYVHNHEIDMEFPGRPGPAVENISYDYGLFNTFVGEKETEEFTSGYVNTGAPQNDGQFHTYRFDWHTESSNPRVDFYVDGNLQYTSSTNIPNRPGRLWLGAWFPRNWAGDPKFDKTVAVVDWVRITPFEESGENPMPESLFPLAPAEWAEFVEYPKSTGGGPTTPPPPPPPPPQTSPTPTPVITPSPTIFNPILNPGFETGDLTGWDPCYGNYGVVFGEANRGTYSLRVTPDDDTISRCFQWVDVSPSTTYKLLARVKTTNNIYAYIGARQYGETGTQSSDYETLEYGPFTTKSDENQVRVYFSAWRQQNGDAYMDDMVLMEQ